MNTLTGLQELMRTTIAAGTVDLPTYFEDGDVIADVGQSRDAIEERRNTRGFVVTVDLPTQLRVTERAPAVTQCHAVVPVVVDVNPEVNTTTGSGKNILEIVDVVCSALLAYTGTDATDRFEHEEEAALLMTNDSGTVSYVIWFRANVVLAEKFNT
jgi:hypothetical protein